MKPCWPGSAGRDTFEIAEKKLRSKPTPNQEELGYREWLDACSGRAIRVELDGKPVIQSITITSLESQDGKCEGKRANFLDSKNWETGLGLRIGDSQDRVSSIYGEPNSSGPASKRQGSGLDVLPVRLGRVRFPSGHGSFVRAGNRTRG